MWPRLLCLVFMRDTRIAFREDLEPRIQCLLSSMTWKPKIHIYFQTIRSPTHIDNNQGIASIYPHISPEERKKRGCRTMGFFCSFTLAKYFFLVITFVRLRWIRSQSFLLFITLKDIYDPRRVMISMMRKTNQRPFRFLSLIEFNHSHQKHSTR